MRTAETTVPTDAEYVTTATLIVSDVARSAAFYRDVFDAVVLREGEPTFLRFGNIWLTINGGGGPTDDKPDVVAAPPTNPNVLSAFINLRVRDIAHCYELWRSRGAIYSLRSQKCTPRKFAAMSATRWLPD